MSDHIVFLGLHNPNRFRDALESWLVKFNFTGSTLVAVDNCSSEDPEHWVRAILDENGVSYAFLRNERNLGGYGSLLRNLGATSGAKWITTLHQDDIYSPEHLQNHLDVIRSSNSPNLGYIFSESVSFSPVTGKEIPFPRGHWLLEGVTEPYKLFLANLKSHVFPFSGASLRRDLLLDFQLPENSVAFPDTELLLLTLPFVEYKFSSHRTVKYLENPESESHSLLSTERETGVYEALTRVLNSESFGELVSQVDLGKRTLFLRELERGVRLRLKSPFHRSMLTHLAQVRMKEIRDQSLGKDSKKLGSNQRQSDISTDANSNFSILDGSRFNRKLLQLLYRKLLVPAGLHFLSSISYPLRKKLFRGFMKTPIGKSVLPHWDFNFF